MLRAEWEQQSTEQTHTELIHITYILHRTYYIVTTENTGRNLCLNVLPGHYSLYYANIPKYGVQTLQSRENNSLAFVRYFIPKIVSTCTYHFVRTYYVVS